MSGRISFYDHLMANSSVVIISDLKFYLIHSGPHCVPKHAYLLYCHFNMNVYRC